MNSESSINLSTPEARMSLPWEVLDDGKVQSIRKLIQGWGLYLPDSLKAFQGGGILRPQEGTVQSPEDQKYLTGDRPIMVILAREGESLEFNRVVHIPTGEIQEPKRFDANLAAYRFALARFVAGKWDAIKGQSPIPVALVTGLKDNRFVTLTEFRDGLVSLGEGGPARGIHELNLRELPIDEIPHLIDTLDTIHVSSNEFIRWVDKNKIEMPKTSWLHKGNPNSALRGQEWWINPDPTKDDRLKELQRASNSSSVKEYYDNIFSGNSFPAVLENMIKANLPLYPHQNGAIDDSKLIGDLVVVHGTLNPGNIHKKLDPKSGQVFYTITGGDRSQLYGLRGQMIDWLVSACASSPEHQQVLINEFLRRYPDEKEKRGLAMHIMYRCIMEAPWFSEHGKMVEVGNLVRLANDIMTGKGVWKGVNTPLMKQ